MALPATTTFQWPMCPQCGSSRQARCASCGNAGTDFPIAEYLPAFELSNETRQSAQRNHGEAESDDTEYVWLMCPFCDEAFRPTYYRRCAACGHEFPDGASAIDPWANKLPVNKRAVFLAWSLIAVLGGLGLYFWSLFAR